MRRRSESNGILPIPFTFPFVFLISVTFASSPYISMIIHLPFFLDIFSRLFSKDSIRPSMWSTKARCSLCYLISFFLLSCNRFRYLDLLF